MSITQVDSVQGESLGFITTFKDITEAKSSEENIKKLAYFDPLTELPNRMLYQDRLNQAIQRSMRNRLYIVVLFLDLDGFKQVNDDFGHALGDVLLTEVARRLEQSVRGDDTVARMGGDEFTVILHALRTRELAENAASQISAKIISVLNQPFLIQGKEIRIGTSIGISTYPDDGNSIEELTKHADTAMYHAKECGKNNYQFFTEDMHQRAAQRQLIEKDILTALENGKFVLAYQPKLDVQKQKLKGFEALLRWNHSEKGMMAPNMFLKAFEDLGLGHQVGEYVLELACRKLKTFAAEGLSSIGVSVNIFARQFRDAGFIASVAELIDSNGIEPDRLTLEFSEKILMEDVGMSFSILSELKRLGVRLAIDDFATGLLSLQTLRRLPLDEVKIDRHMLIQIDKDAEQIDFVFALIEFARNMKLAVTVEGIERSTQLQLVKKSRADVAQGYLFAKPVLEDQLDEMIQQFLLND
jgi:diguanylate cyclase (GGDEF)-like protein